MPLPFTFCPFSPNPPDRSSHIACNLIDLVVKCWRNEALISLFATEETNLIRSIPISIRAPLDTLVWHHEKNGLFTVRSAYYMANEILLQPRGSSSVSLTPTAKLWNKLWKSRVPQKVKVCVWQLCNDHVPTRANLTRRILFLTLHVFYAMALMNLLSTYDESVIHLSRFCLYAKCSWLISSLGVLLRDLHPYFLLDWISDMANRLPSVSFEMALMAL